MYTPKSFEETDQATLYKHIQNNSFGILFSADENGYPLATHLPFMVDTERHTLIAHMARANKHWKSIHPDTPLLCVFQGAHSYISPTWYADHNMAPTWNYVTVHVHGKAKVIHEEAALREMVLRLIHTHDPEFDIESTTYPLDARLKAVVGFEIPIERMEGKYKLNQTRTVEDRRSVIDILSQSPNSVEREVADLMQERLE